MNSSVLQFTLGLGTGNFLHALGDAKGKVVGFIGSVAGFGAVMEGVFSAIEKGAALEHLSKRTSTAVSDLFQLQKGFKAAGVDSDSLGNTLFQMQKALGGVNEQGEDTKSIFYRMGLSVDDLKKMNAPEQINAILKSLDSLGTSDAAKAAASIFGRMNAQNVIQLANSADEFAEAMRDAATDAKNWERIAPLFEQVEKAMKKIKSIGESLFAGIAEGFAPLLLKGIDYLEQMRDKIEAIGKKIGEFGRAFAEAFREGKATELLSLAFEAGFEKAESFGKNFIAAFAAGLSEALSQGLISAFKNAIKLMGSGYLDMGMAAYYSGQLALAKTRLADVQENGTQVGGFGQNISHRKASASDIAAVQKDVAKWEQKLNQAGQDMAATNGALTKDLVSSLISGISSGWNEAKKSWKESGADPSEAQKKLDAMLAGLLAKAPALPTSKDFNKKDGDNLLGSNHYKPEFTSFEKMGFVMGGNNSLQKTSQETANNTRRTVEIMQRLFDGGNPYAPENQVYKV